MVGLGGAAFPTWAKLNEARNPDYKVDTVLVNAAECEPYITSDHRMMLAHPDWIADGIEYLRRYMGECFANAVFKICIEDNKPDAIALLEKTFQDKSYVQIHKLNAIYPQGAKQVMLYNATGRVAVAGRRFPSFGAMIINVSSLALTAHYIKTGMPLVERIVTVDGPAVEKPMNLIAPIGTRIRDAFGCHGLESCRRQGRRRRPDERHRRRLRSTTRSSRSPTPFWPSTKRAPFCPKPPPASTAAAASKNAPSASASPRSTA